MNELLLRSRLREGNKTGLRGYRGLVLTHSDEFSRHVAGLWRAHMARDEMRVKSPESESGSSLDDSTAPLTARLNRLEKPGVRSTKHIYTHLPDPTGWEMIATCLKSPGLGAVCNVKNI